MSDMDERNAGGRDHFASYRRVFETSPDYITFSRVADGTYIDVNPGFVEFMGFSREEVIGKSSLDPEINLWPDPVDRKEFLNAVIQKGGVQGYSTCLRVKSGEIRNVEISANIIEANGEEILVAVVRDVTERKRAEAELYEYRQRLEELVEQRTAELQQSNRKLLETNKELNAAYDRLRSTEQRIRHMAHHDILTGLPNRALIEDRVNQAVSYADRHKTLVALLFVDLDNFKRINDSLGHQVGDKFLQHVADRLRGCVRKSDTVGRLGGDEFVICLSGLDRNSQAALVARKILEQLGMGFQVDGHDLSSGGSVGISMFPADGSTPEELLRAADAAMYRAKHSGRGTYRFFSAE